jgi:hypothetical protein
MTELIVLDAVSVATTARAARDAAAASPDTAPALIRYAIELDEIVEAAVSLDAREHELEHQVRWWSERIAVLESQLTGDIATDAETGRELALFRGRVSGAHAMQRHYVQQRVALIDRHDIADAACASELTGS